MSECDRRCRCQKSQRSQNMFVGKRWRKPGKQFEILYSEIANIVCRNGESSPSSHSRSMTDLTPSRVVSTVVEGHRVGLLLTACATCASSATFWPAARAECLFAQPAQHFKSFSAQKTQTIFYSDEIGIPAGA